jgi:hypothetical protein
MQIRAGVRGIKMLPKTGLKGPEKRGKGQESPKNSDYAKIRFPFVLISLYLHPSPLALPRPLAFMDFRDFRYVA